MAERLESFDFASAGNPALIVYSWNEWMDGEVWKIERDVDYRCTGASMVSQLHQRARKNGMRVRTSSGDDHVVFQFYLE